MGPDASIAAVFFLRKSEYVRWCLSPYSTEAQSARAAATAPMPEPVAVPIEPRPLWRPLPPGVLVAEGRRERVRGPLTAQRAPFIVVLVLRFVGCFCARALLIPLAAAVVSFHTRCHCSTPPA